MGTNTIIGVIPIDRVRAAAERARPHVLRSPLIPIEGAQLKLECLQPTGSFKVRGFFSAALALPPDRLRRGLITVSAGNAAGMINYYRASVRQSQKEAAAKLKPITAPTLVIWGEGDSYLGSDLAEPHPEDVPNLERVVVPVGGGGLISGIASALKGMRPEVEVVGVQSDGYPLWQLAFEAGDAVAPKPDTIADGTTAPFDPRMFELLKEVVDRWLIVPEPRLKAAIPEIAATAKVVAEGAGALAYAALEQLQPGPTTVAVVSGGNIDPTLLPTLLS